MRYLLLLHADVEAAAQTTSDEAQEELRRYAEVTEAMAAAGVLRGGEALMPASEGLHVGQGHPDRTGAVHQDPELSGFYLVECTFEEAIAWARRLPVAAHGRVEIRPIMDMPDPPVL